MILLILLGLTRAAGDLSTEMLYVANTEGISVHRLHSRLLDAALDSSLEVLNPAVDNNIVMLLYHHFKLINYRLSLVNQSLESNEVLMGTCRSIIELLIDGNTSYFPLIHHVFILLAKTLIEASSFRTTKAEATDLLEKLAEWLDGDGEDGRTGWENHALFFISQKLTPNTNPNLQHLAEAAVGGIDVDMEDSGIDWATVIVEGYLSAFITRE